MESKEVDPLSIRAVPVERLRSEIAPILAEWRDSVVPSRVEVLSHCGYAPVYAWMYSYEKRLKYRIEDVLNRKLGALERVLFGADGVFSEAMSNAFVHGHRRDPELAIEVGAAVGDSGFVFTLTDQGLGFDYENTLAAASDGGAYFSYGGNGLRTFLNCAACTASFADGGRTIHLLVHAS